MQTLLKDYINSPYSEADENSKADEAKPSVYFLTEKIRTDIENGISRDKMLADIIKWKEIINTKHSKESKQNELLKVVPETRPGIHFVFAQCPDLEKLGTADQYAEYLDNIFPKSKIKDIVYYCTNSRFEVFEENFVEKSSEYATVGTGFYFNPKPIKGNFSDLMPVVLNAKTPFVDVKYDVFYFGRRLPVRRGWRNLFRMILGQNKWSDYIAISKPYLYSGKVDIDDNFVRRVVNKIENQEKLTFSQLNDVFTEVFKSMKVDSLRHSSNLYSGEEIIVFDPKQIFVLGTRLDVERFRQFVAEQKVNTRISLTG